MAELVGKKWKEEKINPIRFCHETNSFYKGGQLIRHKFNRKTLTIDEIFILLYVDDGALLFETREEVILGSNIILNQMKRMGLKMHIGLKKKESKTEAVFFPSRSKKIEWILDHEKSVINSTEYMESLVDFEEKVKKIPLEKQKKILEKSYNDAEETENFVVNETGFISFTKHFKYLGSWISYDLNDLFDLEKRIMKANQSMGALNCFWNAKEVDIHAKYLIYSAVTINLLLWGCESWALR